MGCSFRSAKEFDVDQIQPALRGQLKKSPVVLDDQMECICVKIITYHQESRGNLII
jgi:hypothetical protein